MSFNLCLNPFQLRTEEDPASITKHILIERSNELNHFIRAEGIVDFIYAESIMESIDTSNFVDVCSRRLYHGTFVWSSIMFSICRSNETPKHV
ncbi:hypothetical protein AVEN_103193-1 [Araneus ventricosus]|uniref:Uncharacterized protein n=1 Tax=Araneus ventricosus TaxID=182803 RepID=A0A4Y2FWG3_ARAVE|nr:hypothetical protein AVEN_103193-1 [Araneus ventricosus]